MPGILLLNATFEPLCVVPLQRAVVLVLAEKAVVVAAHDAQIRSERVALAVPRVIRLTRFVRVPYRVRVPLTRRAVLARDGHACGYCGGQAATVDHIRPRARGGRHEWANVTAACGPCNSRKGDRLLSELGWTLGRRPVEPTGRVTALLVAVGAADPAWSAYLGPVAVGAGPGTVVA